MLETEQEFNALCEMALVKDNMEAWMQMEKRAQEARRESMSNVAEMDIYDVAEDTGWSGLIIYDIGLMSSQGPAAQICNLSSRRPKPVILLALPLGLAQGSRLRRPSES